MQSLLCDEAVDREGLFGGCFSSWPVSLGGGGRKKGLGNRLVNWLVADLVCMSLTITRFTRYGDNVTCLLTLHPA
jgi:hypothetical protein